MIIVESSFQLIILIAWVELVILVLTRIDCSSGYYIINSAWEKNICLNRKVREVAEVWILTPEVQEYCRNEQKELMHFSFVTRFVINKLAWWQRYGTKYHRTPLFCTNSTPGLANMVEPIKSWKENHDAILPHAHFTLLGRFLKKCLRLGNLVNGVEKDYQRFAL